MEKNFFRGSALATWLGFTATFAARPLGGMFLGILSDAFGRKLAVVVTVIGMLSATVGQGLLPTPRRWGDESAMGHTGLVLLFVLRLAQGLCTGGEIGAVSTYIAEVAAPRSICRCVACITITVNIGFICARLVIFALEAFHTEEEMLDGAWRWAFIVALFPGLISVFGRLFCLKESEAFEQEHNQNECSTSDSDDGIINAMPKRESTRRQLKEFVCTHSLGVLLGIGGVVSFAVLQYGGMVWASSFLRKHGASEKTVMLAGISSRLLQSILDIPVGYLADVHGMALVGFAAALVQTCAGLPLFMALSSDPASTTNIFAAW